MGGICTISTCNGPVCDLAHNRREQWRVDQENAKWAERHPGELRIDLSREHQILVDRGSLAQVYHELFDESVKEFNEKMIKTGHPDRIITNYLGIIRAKENRAKGARHPIYELITTVGSKEHPVPEALAKQILLEHAKSFQERNPNLVIVCQALHMDEQIGGAIHIHTSYIPVAYNMKRGMRVQNSLASALKQQGFESKSKSVTAQMLWTKAENNALEAICNKHGYEVIHPQAGTKTEHLTVEEYKASQDLKRTQAELGKVKALPLGTTIIKTGRLQQLEETEKLYNEIKPEIERTRRDKAAIAESMEAYVNAYNKLQSEKADFDRTVNEAANKKLESFKNKVKAFLTKSGLWEAFNNEVVIEVRGIKR